MLCCKSFKVGADPCVCPHFDASHLTERHRVSALHFTIWIFTWQTRRSAPTLNLRINKPYAELTPFYPSKGHISRPKTPPSAMQKVAYYYDVFHAKHLSSFIFAHKALSFSILRGERCFIYLSPDFHL